MQRHETDLGEWSQRLASIVGEQVRLHRLEQGKTAQAVADRTAELGHTVKRSVLAEMETGRRKTVSLADVLVLAQALDIPPMSLFVPGTAAEDLELLPDHPMAVWSAFDWVTGRAPGPETRGTEARDHWLRASDPYQYKEQVDNLTLQIFESARLAGVYEADGENSLMERELAVRRGLSGRLQDLREAMLRAGITPMDGSERYIRGQV